MRFSLAVTAFAAGAVAAVAPSQEEEITVTVTDYTTYCPSATMTDVRSLVYSIYTEYMLNKRSSLSTPPPPARLTASLVLC